MSWELSGEYTTAGSLTDSILNITVTNNGIFVTPHFDNTSSNYSVNLNQSDNGYGAYNYATDINTNNEQDINLNAVAKSGYKFDHWTIEGNYSTGDSLTDNALTVTATGNLNVTPVFAADSGSETTEPTESTTPAEITSPDGKGESKVVATIQPAVFSVTVPTVLPISVDKDRNIYTADNVVITNNSNGPVKVAGAQLTANNGWEIVENGTDYNAVPIDSKQFDMGMQETEVPTNGTIDVTLFDSIAGNSNISIVYNANVAVQSAAISGANIANIVFTVEWDTVTA